MILTPYIAEVTSKTDAEIEAETAEKWLGRALACYHLAATGSDARWLLRAKKFADEAIEHAAFVRDGGKTLRNYEQAIAVAEQQLSGTALDMLGAM